MCGLAGFLSPERLDRPGSSAVLDRMSEAIVHRGPDASGQWLDADAGVALVHRRLAVLDLSAAGHQPMHSACGRFVVVFNGEIYNHLELRKDLDGWNGHSDTETLAAGIARWGVVETLRKCVGMFALAVWDKDSRSLYLARDRLGEKPLYYGWQGKGRGRVLLFGSQLGALRGHPAFDADIDREALGLLLRHGYVKAPHTIYAGIRKLEPGHCLVVSEEGRKTSEIRYWSLEQAVDDKGGGARAILDPACDEDAVEQLDELLHRSIAAQSVADVPLGAFLSGGVDSSTIVAIMQSRSTRPVRTFSVGFDEQAFDESTYAASVARHLGTDHTEVRLTATDAMAVIPRLPHVFDEPFGDSSQIPTCLVAEVARRSVTVALTGDGGDELFGGYSRYARVAARWQTLRRIPLPVRQGISRALLSVPDGLRASVVAVLARLASVGPASLEYRMLRQFRRLGAREAMEFYWLSIAQWLDRRLPTTDSPSREPWAGYPQPDSSKWNDRSAMMLADIATYLPDDILTKVDRATMAVSLEGRVPLLDHRIVEFAFRCPVSQKFRSGRGKWLLRQVLRRYVPDSLIERPKMGFGVPVGDWLRGPLREWFRDLVSDSRMRTEGYLDPQTIGAMTTEHLAGSADWGAQLWTVVMFQAWLDAQAGH